MPIRNALASVAVNDLASAVEWYEKLLGRPADSRRTPDVAEWTFDGGGGLQVYHLPERAGSGSLTLDVSSLEEQLSGLERCGIPSGRRVTTDTARIMMIKDPDGNSIALSETGGRQ